MSLILKVVEIGMKQVYKSPIVQLAQFSERSTNPGLATPNPIIWNFLAAGSFGQAPHRGTTDSKYCQTASRGPFLRGSDKASYRSDTSYRTQPRAHLKISTPRPHR